MSSAINSLRLGRQSRSYPVTFLCHLFSIGVELREHLIWIALVSGWWAATVSMVTWMECRRRAAARLSFTEGAGFLPLSTQTRGRCARLWLMPPAMLQQVEKYRIRRRRSRLLLVRVLLQTALQKILSSGKHLANIDGDLPRINCSVWAQQC